MRFSTAILSFALIFVLALRAEACFSEGLRQTKMADYRRRCEEHGLSEKEIKCLLKEGDKYEPKTHTIHGQVFTCYHDQDYSRHMVSAMSVCINDLEPVSVRTLKSGLNKIIEPERKPRVLRQAIEPSTPMRKVAHWLGLKETVRGSCSCLSGCHICCVNTGLSGDDECFRVWCGGYGYCR